MMHAFVYVCTTVTMAYIAGSEENLYLSTEQVAIRKPLLLFIHPKSPATRKSKYLLFLNIRSSAFTIIVETGAWQEDAV